MITNNFKKLLALMLQTTGTTSANGLIPVVDISGTTKYISSKFDSNRFPTSVTKTVATANSSGIWLGAGTTAPTADNFALESRLSSGFEVTTPTYTFNVDESGNPYLEYIFNVTNTSESDITISEIGYVQKVLVSSSSGSAAGSLDYILLDRTVLNNPITIAAGELATIRYTLKTIL